jgi:CheY-like chemotaxis protein
LLVDRRPLEIRRDAAPSDVIESVRRAVDPVALFDWESGQLIEASEAALREFGRELDDLRRNTAREMTSLACAPLVDLISESVRHSSHYRGPICLNTAHGEQSRDAVMQFARSGGSEYTVNIYREIVEPRWKEGDRRTVLLAEDESSVRAILARRLEPHYRVRTAADGLEAIRWLTRDPTISFVVSDPQMPRVDGAALYEVLCRVRPDLRDRVLVQCGSSIPRALHHLPALHKPYELDDFDEAVQRVAR